jgi:hypothetical protein
MIQIENLFPLATLMAKKGAPDNHGTIRAATTP